MALGGRLNGSRRLLLTASLVLTVLAGLQRRAGRDADGRRRSASVSASPSATADLTDPALIRSTGIPFTSGAVTLTAVAPDATATSDPDGSARLAVPGGALLAAPEGLTLTVLADGTAVVRDAGARSSRA